MSTRWATSLEVRSEGVPTLRFLGCFGLQTRPGWLQHLSEIARHDLAAQVFEAAPSDGMNIFSVFFYDFCVFFLLFGG
jgi:hypothetical protein